MSLSLLLLLLRGNFNLPRRVTVLPLQSAGRTALPAGAAPPNYQHQRVVCTAPEVNLAGGGGRQAARAADLAATLPLFHPRKSLFM